MTNVIHHGEALEVMSGYVDQSFDVIFADPPYFLSGKGSTCKAGKRAPVHKGEWDEPTTPEEQLAWTRECLVQYRRLLKPHGTLWNCGTLHSVPTSGYALQLEGFRTLNNVAWTKPNPPPNLGCRCLTHSYEVLTWASLGPKAKHHFDYEWARAVTGKQMRDVWSFTAAPPSEKIFGKHPTQKPIELVKQALMVSVPAGGTVLDPFMGSGTTGVAADRCERSLSFVGIEREREWFDLASRRLDHLRNR